VIFTKWKASLIAEQMDFADPAWRVELEKQTKFLHVLQSLSVRNNWRVTTKHLSGKQLMMQKCEAEKQNLAAHN